MLGKQIMELQGKIIGQRVIDVDGPTMETTLNQNGKLNDMQINETVSYISRPNPSGVLHAKGNGVIFAMSVEKTEIATFTAEGFGKISSQGSLTWRGSHFYKTTSTSGNLAILKDVIGMFEAGISESGNSSKLVWEWK